MSRHILFQLNNDWALGADHLQWIVFRRRKLHGGTKWQALSFIGSYKRILMGVLREKGVEVRPEAEAALNALPDTFMEWLKTQNIAGRS